MSEASAIRARSVEVEGFADPSFLHSSCPSCPSTMILKEIITREGPRTGHSSSSGGGGGGGGGGGSGTDEALERRLRITDGISDMISSHLMLLAGLERGGGGGRGRGRGGDGDGDGDVTELKSEQEWTPVVFSTSVDFSALGSGPLEHSQHSHPHWAFANYDYIC